MTHHVHILAPAGERCLECGKPVPSAVVNGQTIQRLRAVPWRWSALPQDNPWERIRAAVAKGPPPVWREPERPVYDVRARAAGDDS